MSYQLVVSGHLANPEEEAEIRDKCEAFVRELVDQKQHEVTGASFNGSYTGFTFTGLGTDAPLVERRGYDPAVPPIDGPDGGTRAD